MAKRIFDWASPDAGQGGYLVLAEPGDAPAGGGGSGGTPAVTRIQATDVACPAGVPTTLGDPYLLKAGHMYAVVATVSGTATAAGRADTTLVADADLGSTLPGTLLTPLSAGFGAAGTWGGSNDQSDVFAAPVDVTIRATTTLTVDGTATLDLWIVDLGPNAGGGGSGIAVGPLQVPSPLPNLNDQVSPPDPTKPYWISVEVSGTWDNFQSSGTMGLDVISSDSKTRTTVAEVFSSRTPENARYALTLSAILAPGEKWEATGPNGYVNITRVTERALA